MLSRVIVRARELLGLLVARVLPSLVMSASAFALVGCTSRTIQVKTEPLGATVTLDGKQIGKTPVEEKLSWWSEDSVHSISIELQDYESEFMNLTRAEAKAQPDPWVIRRNLNLLVKAVEVELISEPAGAAVYYTDGSQVRQLGEATPTKLPVRFQRANSRNRWPLIDIAIEKEEYERKPIRLSFEQVVANPTVRVGLERLRHAVAVQFITDPPGADVSVDGGRSAKTPGEAVVVFSRSSSQHAWLKPRVTVSLADHETQVLELNYQAVMSNPQVRISLARIRLEVPIDITANIEAAAVDVDGKTVGTTPLRHSFVFVRNDGKTAWNNHLIVVRKDGYRYRAPGVPLPAGANPPFSDQLTIEDPAVSSRKLVVNLEQSLYYRVKYTRFRFGTEGVVLEEISTLSQIREGEQEPKVGKVTKITDFDPGKDYLIETRISVLSDNETIMFSVPFRLPGTERPYMNLWMQRGGQRTRVTDANMLDLEASVSSNGQYVYFMSNRLGTTPEGERFNLWRTGVAGKGGLTKITDSPSVQIDSSPAVSPDGTRIAYHSWSRGSRIPYVWVAKSDGTLPTQLRIGRNASWSPDGARLVYVEPDSSNRDKISVMGADGSDPTQITAGAHDDQYPMWTPDGKRIIFASNEAINEEQQQNFDIWIMNTDGTGKTQLTVNGSDDTRPAISPDGKHVYFISTRGAKKEGEQPAQIWRMDLPQEISQSTKSGE